MKFYFVFLLTISSSFASATDVFVTTHKSNQTEVGKESVVKILKAETLNWKEGHAINLLINDLSDTNSEDVEHLLEMSKKQFLEYWRIKFFSGRALLPKQVKSVVNVLPVLADNKYSIYICIGKTPEKELLEHPMLKTVALKF